MISWDIPKDCVTAFACSMKPSGNMWLSIVIANVSYATSEDKYAIKVESASP